MSNSGTELIRLVHHGDGLPVAFRVDAAIEDSSEQVLFVIEYEGVEHVCVPGAEVLDAPLGEDVLVGIELLVTLGEDIPDVVSNEVFDGTLVDEAIEQLLVIGGLLEDVLLGVFVALEAAELGVVTELRGVQVHMDLLLRLVEADDEDLPGLLYVLPLQLLLELSEELHVVVVGDDPIGLGVDADLLAAHHDACEDVGIFWASRVRRQTGQQLQCSRTHS